MKNPAFPFERSHFVDKPAIVGARWWQESLDIADPVARRKALKAMLIAAGALAGLGAILALAAASGDDKKETETALRNALEMQREYGWNFGATSESLTYDGQSPQPFDRSALDRMPNELGPAQSRLRPYYTPTLFQAPAALPRAVPAGDPAAVVPLREALAPIFTPAMDAAYRQGKSLSLLFEGTPQDKLVIVDLPGPEAVAFAAGMADRFDPCFTFDNWPHPRGVVSAHRTLAAAAYYQPLFVRTSAARKQPAFGALVLDRQRLSTYADESSQFDNRYAAKLPDSMALKALGYKYVLYVVPRASDTLELEDLNDDFLAYTAAGLDVKITAAADFAPDPARASKAALAADAGAPALRGPGGLGTSAVLDAGVPKDTRAAADEPLYFFGGQEDTHEGFWSLYPWGPPPRPVRRVPANVSSGYLYKPSPRSTPFTGSASRPAGFGMVPVIVAAGTGLLLGAKLSRSGSWNRASSGG